jgi:hypothetical protein
MLAMPSAVSVWAGCVTDEASGNGVEVTDSAGIRVVTHHGVERPVGSLGDAPLLSIGTVQDDGITATEWRVFGADGRSVGALVLPERAEVLDATRDRLLLLTRDELDVESIELGELRLPGV